MARSGFGRSSGGWKATLLRVVLACAATGMAWALIAYFADDWLWGWWQGQTGRWWNDKEAHGWFKDTLYFLNFVYTLPAALVLLVWACLIGGPKSERWRLVTQVVMGLVVLFIPVSCGKTLLPRHRPKAFAGHSWPDSFLGLNFSWPDHNYKVQSFFSGDAAMAFVVATILAFHFPRFRVIFYVAAVGCACSRFFLRAHWPSDVFLGAVVGYVVGRLVLVFTGDVRTSS